MPYTKVQFAPGFDKQNTEISSKGKWIDGDKVSLDINIRKDRWLGKGI